MRSLMTLLIPVGEHGTGLVRDVLHVVLSPAEANVMADFAAALVELKASVGPGKPVEDAADAVQWIAQKLLKFQARENARKLISHATRQPTRRKVMTP